MLLIKPICLKLADYFSFAPQCGHALWMEFIHPHKRECLKQAACFSAGCSQRRATHICRRHFIPTELRARSRWDEDWNERLWVNIFYAGFIKWGHFCSKCQPWEVSELLHRVRPFPILLPPAVSRLPASFTYCHTKKSQQEHGRTSMEVAYGKWETPCILSLFQALVFMVCVVPRSFET